MRRPVAVATAFGASGAAWLAGFCVLNPDLVTPELSPVVSLGLAYVVVGSTLLAVRDDQLPSTLLGLWAAAVCLLGAVLSQDDPAPSVGLLVLVSLLYGTVAFVAWAAIGLIMVSLLGHRSPHNGAHG